MRLPEFLTSLSPIRETLDALRAGEDAMQSAVAEKNRQLCAATATSALSLWERDLGLPVQEGAPPERRRAAIRAALVSGRVLTPALLEELCRTLGGGDSGRVTEDFAHWRVTAEVVFSGRLPTDPAPLEQAVERLKPAHLEICVQPRGELSAVHRRYAALTGAMTAEIPLPNIP